MTAPFDFPALQQVCGGWPGQPIPDGASNGTLSRLRQVLHTMLEGGTNCSADLIPLVRQALLFRGREGKGSLSVPLATGWPSARQWHAAGFEAWETGAFVQLSTSAPRLAWLGDGADLFDDAFSEVPSPAVERVPMDPFLARASQLGQYLNAGQREALRAMFQLPPGKTLLANLPTGSGKSLLGQAAALVEGGVGKMTIVVVPTVALAMDQTRRMAQMLHNVDPGVDHTRLAYYGAVSAADKLAIRRAIADGAQRILFTSPESVTGSLRGVLEQAARRGYVRTVVVDEAHLVVGWGDGFRPAFQLLPALIQTMRRLSERQAVRVVLASATLTATTVKVLQHLFGPPQDTYMVAAVHLRPEPRYGLLEVANLAEQRAHIMEAVHAAPRPFILYVTEPGQAEWWWRELRTNGYGRLGIFHGDTKDSERSRVLTAWDKNELDGVVATSAFGLGVDKNDVRAVIHATLPESLDRFYQEVGRGGRDGKACASLLVFEPADLPIAAGISSPTFISNEGGLERWLILLASAVPDRDDPALHWVDLRLRPPHLMQDSKANLGWNLRTLTLMARAGLIELVAIDSGVPGGDVSSVVAQLRRAAVRIVNPGHRQLAVFSPALDRARTQAFGSSGRGLELMLNVARGKEEISAVLSEIYSLNLPGATVSVAAECSGCPRDWTTRHQAASLSPPIVHRLHGMAPPDIGNWCQRWPVWGGNTTFVAFPPDQFAAQAPAKVIELLLDALPVHSVLLPERSDSRLADPVRAFLRQRAGRPIFIDKVGANSAPALRGAAGEVRVVVLDPAQRFPDELWSSECALQVILIPATLPDPYNGQRRLLDTRPHINHEEFIARLIG